MARERRHKPRHRKRRRFGAIRKLLSMVLTTGAIVSACLVFFRINEIEVVGQERYLPQEVIQASGVETGRSLILLSESRVAKSVEMQLPYIQTVDVRRALPDRVVVTIREHEAVAAISGPPGSSWWILAAQGKVLESCAPGQELLEITGLSILEPEPGHKAAVEEGLEERLSRVLELLQLLEQRDMLAQCQTLHCGSSSMSLRYLSFDVELPYHGELESMLELLKQALERGKIAVGTEGICDFTVTEGRMYFRRRK